MRMVFIRRVSSCCHILRVSQKWFFKNAYCILMIDPSWWGALQSHPSILMHSMVRCCFKQVSSNVWLCEHVMTWQWSGLHPSGPPQLQPHVNVSTSGPDVIRSSFPFKFHTSSSPLTNTYFIRSLCSICVVQYWPIWKSSVNATWAHFDHISTLCNVLEALANHMRMHSSAGLAVHSLNGVTIERVDTLMPTKLSAHAWSDFGSIAFCCGAIWGPKGLRCYKITSSIQKEPSLQAFTHMKG